MSLRTPLSRARGLGSAKEGTHHWWMQRVTAVALIPLSLWFVITLMTVVGEEHAKVVAWIAHPFNAVLLIAFLFATFYHASLGLQVVIEDYLHEEATKIGLLLFMKFAMVLLGAFAILAVLRIAIGGAHV
ncbi:MAG: succinate dehydrogenase, hydrophobic membrane anchor protein [Gammaproteobacteria bacterium]|nr:succinate dehydrogenase, hydrophobic membrane anchor protein [Gammaproteobacteria bacterium]MCP5423509.1 succinate dehydrogenase, hydrophobic membrane anchor protein [Gammaproteobacteria bacterium]